MSEMSTVTTKLRSADGLSATGAVARALRAYATFSGRASRTEYWWFALFAFVVVAAAGTVDLWSLGVSGGWGWSPYTALAVLALAVPSLAVNVRRLHDTNRSAVWMLVALVPFVGPMLLAVLALQPGSIGANRYGDPPPR